MNIEIKEDKVIIDYDIVMSIDTVIKSIEYTRKWLDILIEAKRMYDESFLTEDQKAFIAEACSNDRGCINNAIQMLRTSVADVE